MSAPEKDPKMSDLTVGHLFLLICGLAAGWGAANGRWSAATVTIVAGIMLVVYWDEIAAVGRDDNERGQDGRADEA